MSYSQVKQSSSTLSIDNTEDKEVDSEETGQFLVDSGSLIAREEVPGGFLDCGFTKDSPDAIAMNEYQQQLPDGEGGEEKKVNRGSIEYVWNLLKKNDSKAYLEWKSKTAEERDNIYNGLDKVHKDMLDVASSGWIRRETVLNIDAGMESKSNNGTEIYPNDRRQPVFTR